MMDDVVVGLVVQRGLIPTTQPAQRITSVRGRSEEHPQACILCQTKFCNGPVSVPQLGSSRDPSCCRRKRRRPMSASSKSRRDPVVSIHQ